MVNWPDPIVDSLARRKAAIIIGSGVSANAKDPSGNSPPTWGAFLDKACSKLDRTPRHVSRAISGKNYLHACEYLKNRLGKEWDSILKDNFLSPKYKHSDIHKHIFDLDSRFVISLNFDRIYDNYVHKNAEGTYYIKNYYDEDLGQIIGGSDRYLIKAHGTIDRSDKLIFTLKDYAKARVEYSKFYKIMDSILLLNSVVMIGCGLSDPDIQYLFENNKYLFNDTSHYMILPNEFNSEEKKLYEETRGINIIQYKRRNNDHGELTIALAELVELVNDRRQLISTNMDW